MTGRTMTLLAAGAMIAPAVADAQTTCDAKVAALASIETDYKDQQTALQTEGDDIQRDGSGLSGTATFDVKMKEQRWIFHLPTMTMKLKPMSLDLPQMTMKTRAISWDNPTIVMVPTKTGQYPTFRCRGFKCTVKWKDIITNVPRTEMRRQSISMGVPEFQMKRTDFSTKIPEFTMKKQEWVMKIPEFTLVDAQAEGETLQKRGKALGEKADTLAGTIKAQAGERSAAVYACYRTDLADKRQEVAAQFDTALGQIDASITSIRAAGADPAKMQTEDGVLDLIAERARLVTERDDALKQIDAAMASLDAQQQTTTADIIA